MNRKQIEKARDGGVELGWLNSYRVDQNDSLGQRDLVRVKVLKIDLGGEPIPDDVPTWKARDYHKRIVQVEALEDHQGPGHSPSKNVAAGDQRWVEPRFLIDEWKTYAEARDRYQHHLEEQRSTDARKAGIRARHVEALDAILVKHGLPAQAQGTPDGWSESATTARVVLTLEQVRRLVEGS